MARAPSPNPDYPQQHPLINKPIDNIRWVRLNWGQMDTADPHTLQATLREWHRSFPVDLVRDRIRALEAEITKASAEVRFLSERVEEWESFGQIFAEGSNGARFERAGANIHRSKPDIAREILKEQPTREFKLEEIRLEAIQRRWMTANDNDTHALQMALSKMYKRGEVERTRPGFYRHKLPAFEPLVLGPPELRGAPD